MKIGDLDEHCGNCPLIKYCTEAYETPQLCTEEGLEDIDTDTYKEIANNITEEEIADKLIQYDENNVGPWDDERNGAILDIVLEKMYRGGAEQ